MPVFFNNTLILLFGIHIFLYWVFLKKSETSGRIFLIFFFLTVLFWLSPIMFAILVGITPIYWLIQTRKKIPILLILLGVVWVFVKYGSKVQSQDQMAWWFLPLGFSYLVLRVVQYLADIYRGRIDRGTFLNFLLFLVFIPILPAGPIEKFQDFYAKEEKRFHRGIIIESLTRIIIGYFKKAFVLELLLKNSFQSPLESSACTWMVAVGWVSFQFLKAYLDLSSYTDLAIGFSRLYGFRIRGNFNYPFFKKNLSEFWQSWHMSLSEWCRDQIFFPVLGVTRQAYVALFFTMVCMGLWHELSLNWLVWGVYHGAGLCFLQALKKFQGETSSLAITRGGAAVSYICTFLYVALGYSFVATKNINEGFKIFLMCFHIY